MDCRSVAGSPCRCLLAIAVLLAPADHANAERLPIKVYTTADGLSQNQIIRVVRDSRGLLWFCTREGLSRFDGHTFISYTQADGLPHRSVRDIIETGNGEYFIATKAGIVRWRSAVTSSVSPGAPQPTAKHFAHFEVLSPGDDDASRDVWRLFRDPIGTIWAGSDAGLFRVESDGDSVRFIATDIGLPSTAPDSRLVQDIAMDREGALWVATRASGLYCRLRNGRTIRYTTREGLPTNRVNTLLVDSQGRVWAGTSRGLARLRPVADSHEFVMDRVFTKRSGLLGDWIDALWQAPDGLVWVGGVGVTTIATTIPGEAVRSYGVAEGIVGYEVNSLVEDLARNLWMGTADGAVKLSRDGLTSYGVSDGIGTPVTGGILSGSNDRVALYDYDRLAIFDGRRFIRTRVNFGRRVQPPSQEWGRVALRDRSGEFWFATDRGLYRFPRVARLDDLSRVPPAHVYGARHSLGGDQVLTLFEDSRGDIWILSDSGWSPALTRWEHATSRFHRFSDSEGWPSATYVTDFAEDRSGNLWMAGINSLLRYRNGRFTRFTRADGLSTDSVSSVHVDRAGRLWIATDTAGVMRIDSPPDERIKGQVYSTTTGLSSDQTFTITEDTAGRIYIVTGRGVDRLDVTTGAIRHYTTAEGLAAGPLSFRDSTGALWFGSTHELSRLVPSTDSPRIAPTAWISGVSVEGRPQSIPDLGTADDGTLSLAADERQVSVDFFGIGERLRYEYRLVGNNDRWSTPTDQRTVHYASLSPGRYRFEVRAVATDSGLRSSPATVAFVIPPPVWLRWWFLTLAGLIVALALYGVHRRRVAHLVEVERVRTRIATDLHDDLGANLSRVAILSEVVKQRIGQTDDQSVSLLTEIADSSRSLIGSLRDLVWAIDPGAGSAGELDTRVRQIAGTLLDPKSVAWTFRGGDADSRLALNAEQRRHVILFFKEAINNAARYADASRIDLSIEQTRAGLVCRISDNGCGFDVSTASGQGGRGLRNMRTRASALGGRLEVLSTPDAGTALTLTVPLTRKVLGA